MSISTHVKFITFTTLVNQIPVSHAHYEEINNRQETFTKMCRKFIETEPDYKNALLTLNSSVYFKHLNLWNVPIYTVKETIHKPPLAHITISLPPKVGCTNWRYVMNAIQKNKTIEQTSQASRWGGSGLYKGLKPYQGFLKQKVRRMTPEIRDKIESGLDENERVGNFNEAYSFPIKNLGYNGMLDVMKDEFTSNSLSKSVKIIAARHPLARLQSCWRDKFSSWFTDNVETRNRHDGMNEIFAGNVAQAQKYETETSVATKVHGNKVSFEAFLRYITSTDGKIVENCEVWPCDDPMKVSVTSQHWIPIYIQSRACIVNYNFIAKLETAKEDVECLKELLDLGSIGDFPRAYDNTQMDSSRFIEHLQYLYKDISAETMNKVCFVYKWDFLLFGYDMTPFCEIS